MSIQEKIDDKLDEWERKIVKRAIRPNQKPRDLAKDKMIAAGLGAISGLAVSTLGPMLFRRGITPIRRRIKIKPVIGFTTGGAVAGFTTPPILEAIIAESRGELPEGTSDEMFKKRQGLERNLDKAFSTVPTFKK